MTSGRIDEATLSTAAMAMWPARAPCRSLYVGGGSLQVLVDRNDMTSERLADRRQCEACRPAVEELGTDFLFELDDLAIHRGRCNVELSRCLADRFGAPGRIEIADRRGMNAPGHGSTSKSVCRHALVRQRRNRRVASRPTAPMRVVGFSAVGRLFLKYPRSTRVWAPTIAPLLLAGRTEPQLYRRRATSVRNVCAPYRLSTMTGKTRGSSSDASELYPGPTRRDVDSSCIRISANHRTYRGIQRC